MPLSSADSINSLPVLWHNAGTSVVESGSCYYKF